MGGAPESQASLLAGKPPSSAASEIEPVSKIARGKHRRETKLANGEGPARSSTLSAKLAALSPRCVVGVHGQWYDLTTFVPKHPGGDILWKFNGLDATEVYTAFHTRPGLLKMVKEHRIGSYARPKDAVNEDYAKLSREFIREGYMTTDWVWTAWNVLRVFLFLAAAIYLSVYAGWPMVAGFCMMVTWQQCGGIVHDTMHTNVTYNREIDWWIGWVAGPIGLGINAEWWKWEHDLHHALTNTYTTAPETHSRTGQWPYPTPDKTATTAADNVAAAEPAQAFAVDVQLKEDLWAQSLEVLEIFPNDDLVRKLIPYQHWIFVPLVFLLGRVGVLAICWRHGGRPMQLLGFAIHLYLCYSLSLCFPSVWYGFKFWYTAFVAEGILHLQLMVNHYCNQWDLSEAAGQDFVRWQCNATHNVASPAYLDWTHVGLNIHIEHHLFPKVSRTHFRDIKPHVEAFCKKHGLPYRTLPTNPIPTIFNRLREVVEDATSRGLL